MPIINITVAGKIATNTTPGEVIVCGNSDYSVKFALDSEWDAEPNRTARFVYYKNGLRLYKDKEFTGDTVAVPVLSNIDYVEVGVYAGDLRTTTPARVFCDRSILCGEPLEDLGPEARAALQAQIGDLSQLQTSDKSSLVAAINEAAKSGAAGLTELQATALDNMFKVCAYDESKDYASAYMAFKQAFGLAGSGGGEEPEPETPATYSILNTLTNVTSSNAAVSTSGGNAYYATLTPADGHTIDSVIVTMGGVDISATAVNGAEIGISSVTGDIVIIATAAENQAQPVEMSPWYLYGSATLYADDGSTDPIATKSECKACSVSPFEVDTIISFTYVNGDSALYMPPRFACIAEPVTGNAQNPVGYYAETPTHAECGSPHTTQLPAGETHTYTYTVKAGYYLFIGYENNSSAIIKKGTFTITGKAV